MPNTAIAASPMNFSTTPPWRSTMVLTRSNERVRRPRSVSGSICSPMAVDPTRSQKRTVTVLRDSALAAAATSAAPQDCRTANRPGSRSPQVGQVHRVHREGLLHWARRFAHPRRRPRGGPFARTRSSACWNSAFASPGLSAATSTVARSAWASATWTSWSVASIIATASRPSCSAVLMVAPARHDDGQHACCGPLRPEIVLGRQASRRARPFFGFVVAPKDQDGSGNVRRRVEAKPRSPREVSSS